MCDEHCLFQDTLGVGEWCGRVVRNVQLVQVCKVFREKQQDNKSDRPIFHFHIKSLRISAAASNLYVIFDKRMISN